MDLGAFGNISDGQIGRIVRENGIYVPRLRGYRLMVQETPENVDAISKDNVWSIIDDLCSAYPFWNPNTNFYGWNCHRLRKYRKYVDKDFNVHWELIHGWKRRVLKTAIHNKKKAIKTQYDVWNKYCGRNDILYIHARIGGGNWPEYKDDVIHESWFIEKVDDFFDPTYCDIYARIKPVEEDRLKEMAKLSAEEREALYGADIYSGNKIEI